MTLQGTLNDGEGDDTSWTVEIAWPWESITGHSSLPRRGSPPPPGTVMRMNFSRVDHVDGVERNTVWAPTRLKTIHAPEHWGRVRISANPVGTPERPDPTVGLWVHGNDASVTAKSVGAWADADVTTLIVDGSPAELEAALPRILDVNPEGFCLFAHDGLTPERLAALRRVVLKSKSKGTESSAMRKGTTLDALIRSCLLVFAAMEIFCGFLT